MLPGFMKRPSAGNEALALGVAFGLVPLVLGLARLDLLGHSPRLLATVHVPLRTVLEWRLLEELVLTWTTTFMAGRALWRAVEFTAARHDWSEDRRMNWQQPILLLGALAACWALSLVAGVVTTHATDLEVRASGILLAAQVGLIWVWLSVRIFGPESECSTPPAMGPVSQTPTAPERSDGR